MVKCLSKKKKKGQMGPKRLHLKLLCFLGQATVYMWTYCIIMCVCVIDGWLALLDLLKSSLEYGKLATAQTKKDGYPYIFIVTKK